MRVSRAGVYGEVTIFWAIYGEFPAPANSSDVQAMSGSITLPSGNATQPRKMLSKSLTGVCAGLEPTVSPNVLPATAAKYERVVASRK